MNITFHGAARTTTGSMHLLEIKGKRILFDCGLYQGRRKEAFERNRQLSVDAASIDTVLLSHAHIDHSGNLPTLISKGFTGKIIATPATCDLCDIMLKDSAHIQEKDVEYVNRKRHKEGKNPFEPLYTFADVENTMKCFSGVPYENEIDIAPGAKATFHDAGHLLGSAMISIDISDNGSTERLLFTGDMGRKDMPILEDPTVVQNVDILITESTYGNRFHPPKEDVLSQLAALVEDIQKKRSKLIIPSFSVGRTQQIVLFLHEIHQQGKIPRLPVFVDSPLSTKATGIYEKHSECFDSAAIEILLHGEDPFQFKGLHYVAELEESKQLNSMPGPAIIISASGMCEGGRILHHLKNNIEDPRNIILIVGYQAQNTLGRRLVEKQSPIRIFGDEYEVRARVHTINALSAHADHDELMDYFKAMGPEVRKAFVVHGEEEQSEALAVALREVGAHDVVVPEPGQTFEI